MVIFTGEKASLEEGKKERTSEMLCAGRWKEKQKAITQCKHNRGERKKKKKEDRYNFGVAEQRKKKRRREKRRVRVAGVKDHLSEGIQKK